MTLQTFGAFLLIMHCLPLVATLYTICTAKYKSRNKKKKDRP